MAKKIKFALEMANGAKVRTIEDLRDKFDIEKAITYFLNGKLLEWLKDRYYTEIADAVQSLDGNAPDFNKRLCEALEVEYQGENISLEKIEQENIKRTKLKQITSDEEIISHAAETAFSQDELNQLLDTEVSTVYLCGEEFYIPMEKQSRRYIGIGKQPVIHIKAETIRELEERNIFFENVNLPENLLRRRWCQPYQVSSLFEPLMSEEDKRNAEQLYKVAEKILGNIVFDPVTAFGANKN